jgi:hypothetical protein
MKILAAFVLAFYLSASGQGFQPKGGFVPDKETAVKIAEAVLIPVYGKTQIESEQPFDASLKDGVWIVSGSLNCGNDKHGKPNVCVGGVAVVRISKADGRIIDMIHYK